MGSSNNLLTVTQLEGDRAGMGTSTVWLQSLCLTTVLSCSNNYGSVGHMTQPWASKVS